MTKRLPSLLVALLLAGGAAGAQTGGTQTPTKPAQAPAPLDITQANGWLNVDVPDYLSAGKWADAVKLCDEIILRAKEQTETPEIRKIMIRAYDARGRARLNIANQLKAAHDDFYALLCLEPDHKLAEPVTEGESTEYQKMRDATLGHVTLSMFPKGTARLERTDGLTSSVLIELDKDPKTVDLVGGPYRVTATTPTGSYDQLDDTLTVTAGSSDVVKVLTLVRRTSTLSVVSIPAGAEVLLDDASKGPTKAADGSAARPTITDLQPAADTKAAVQAATPSAPMLLEELKPEPHTLQLRLRCFKPFEQKFTLVRQGDVKGETFLPGDLTPDSFRDQRPEAIQQGAFRLIPATATVKMQAADAGGALYLDGEKRAGVPADPVTLCEGLHTIEVRGPRGRFMDTRQWNAAPTEEKLDVQLRNAFAIGNLQPGQTLNERQQAALAAVKNGAVLVYMPYDKELADAAKDPGLTDFWSPNPTDGISKEGRIIRVRQLADRLQAQGLAAVTADAANPAIIRLSLLAPGSSVPSVITINTEDPTSKTQAGETMGAALPQFWRRSIGVSVTDADHVHGAAIIHVVDGGAGARAGLKVGNTIVRAGGAAIESVADWEAALKKTVPGTELTIDVKGPDQGGIKVSVGIEPDALAFTPGTASLRGSPLPANVGLVSLQEATVRPASAPVDAATVQAALVNLAIVHEQLGNWQAALDALEVVDVSKLGDGPGVSTGTVAYLKGLALEKLDKDAEAQAEFKKAAGAKLARLDADGPLVWPLAQLKVHPAR